MTSTVKIPEGWIEGMISDVADVLNGYPFKSSDLGNYEDGLFPVFKMGNINRGGGLRWTGKEDYYCGDITKIDSKFFTQKNDILMSMTDMQASMELLGYSAKIKNEKFIVNQRVGIIRPKKEKIDPDYLSYFMNNKIYIDLVRTQAHSGVQVNLTTDGIKTSPVWYPQNPQEQKAIAGVLSAFDDKIELLRAENQTLEEMGQTLFKERFGKYKVGDELPDGWKVGKLGDVVDNYDSKRIPIASDKREIGEYPYYGATGINGYVKDYIFDGIYTLLGEDGSVMKENGKPFTQYVWGKIRVNNHAHVLQGKNGFSTEMIKIILDSVDITPYVTGAVQLKISQGNMNSIPVIIPTDNVLVKFNSLINPIFAKIRANSEEIESLSKTRDQLLPKLMSGEVRVEF